jgi:hypothetical protein
MSMELAPHRLFPSLLAQNRRSPNMASHSVPICGRLAWFQSIISHTNYERS